MTTATVPRWLNPELMFPRGLVEETHALTEEIRALIPAVEDICKRAYLITARHNEVSRAVSASMDAAVGDLRESLSLDVDGGEIARTLGGWWHMEDALHDIQSHLIATMEGSTTRTPAWYVEFEAERIKRLIEGAEDKEGENR